MKGETREIHILDTPGRIRGGQLHPKPFRAISPNARRASCLKETAKPLVAERLASASPMPDTVFMYSIALRAPSSILARPSARLLHGSGMRPMQAMPLRIAAGKVASPLDSLAAHA